MGLHLMKGPMCMWSDPEGSKFNIG